MLTGDKSDNVAFNPHIQTLEAQIAKAQLKYEVLKEQLQNLQLQVKDAKSHLESLQNQLHHHAKSTNTSTKPGSKRVELEPEDDDADESPTTSSANSNLPLRLPGPPPPLPPEELKRKREATQERIKEREKKQRLEQFEASLGNTVESKARGRGHLKAANIFVPQQQFSIGNDRIQPAPVLSSAPSKSQRQSQSQPRNYSQPSTAPQQPRFVPDDTKDDEPSDTCAFSHLRLVKRLVPAENMANHMQGRKLVQLKDITKTMEFGDIDGDWVTFGVIADKTHAKTAVNDKKYCVFKLNDLSGTQVNLFLFDEAFETHYKESIGAVIAILNPNIARPQESTDPIGINVDVADKLLKIGTSRDLAICKATRKDGKPCSMAVDAREGQFCHYHVESNFRNFKNKRQEFASNTGEISVGPPKKNLDSGSGLVMGGKFGTTSVVRTRAKPNTLPLAEQDSTPTYNFGGGQMISLAERKVVEKPLKLSGEMNAKINDELMKKLNGDKSIGSRHLRLSRGIADIEGEKFRLPGKKVNLAGVRLTLLLLGFN